MNANKIQNEGAPAIPDTCNWTAHNFYQFNMPAIHAYAEHRRIQYWSPGVREWREPSGDNPAFWCALWRPAPQPVLAPWNFDTVPRFGWIRRKTDPKRVYLVAIVTENALYLVSYGFTNYKEMLEDCEWSANGLTDWMPCGYVPLS